MMLLGLAFAICSTGPACRALSTRRGKAVAEAAPTVREVAHV